MKTDIEKIWEGSTSVEVRSQFEKLKSGLDEQKRQEAQEQDERDGAITAQPQEY